MPLETPRQPWLHELVSTLAAPTVVLSAADGQLRAEGAQGVLHADIRALSEAVLLVDGTEPTPIAGGFAAASRARFSSIARSLGDVNAPDPTVRLDRHRTVVAGLMAETVEVTSTASTEVVTDISLLIASDLAGVEQIKSGLSVPRVEASISEQQPDPTLRTENSAPGAGQQAVRVRWVSLDCRAELVAPGATADAAAGSQVELHWQLTLPPGARVRIGWTLRAETPDAPVVAVSTPSPWRSVVVKADDHRLTALVGQSLQDLAALRLAPADAPADEFLGAGSPWFFTLFGRDSIWAARLMLPFGWEVAAGTLRALAARQGRTVDEISAEAPGKIPHELRRQDATHIGFGGNDGTMQLPALYYGTVDATPLWICLLHDAWRSGMPEEQVRPLLGALESALGWLRDYADPDGDGFLEYLDASGRGLANQGWKDSGDSIRYADGTIADGPVALCEVQGYAYEAAVSGAALLEAFGVDGAEQWRSWAAALAARFRERFWVTQGGRRYPALALDGRKNPVDSLTSNIGHLLATGILDEDESRAVADLVTSDVLDSGFGLRTMASDAGGYSPLSYHCGSVWAHDTAIAIRGLALSGHGSRAVGLIDGLLAAGVVFGNRLPELYSGDARLDSAWPVPYPAACRPQAWSAAAIGAILQCALGLRVDVPAKELAVHPARESAIGAITVAGLRAGDEEFSVEADPAGTVRVTGCTLKPSLLGQ